MKTSKLGLKERLVRYMEKNHTSTFISSGALQKLVVQHSTHTPRSAVRRLQELCEEGKLTRELRNGHAWYRFARCEACEAAQKQLQAFNNT